MVLHPVRPIGEIQANSHRRDRGRRIPNANLDTSGLQLHPGSDKPPPMTDSPSVRPLGSHVHRWGQWLSLACAIHCLALPLAIGLLPLLGLAFLADERVEWVMLAAMIVFAAAAAMWGLRQHRRLWVVMAFAGAIGVIFLGHALGHGTIGGAALSGVGGLGIAGAHLLNRRLVQSCTACACGTGER